MLIVDPDALEDLRSIAAVDREAAGKLVALIEQLRCDPALKAHLLDHGFGEDRAESISVSKWHDMNKVHRLPVWRLKSWDMEQQRLKYRIIYIYNWMSLEYVILAVVPRDKLDYDDPRHPIRTRVVQRIRRDYNRI